MPDLFRAMQPDDAGLPRSGPSARTLGARAGIDLPVNDDGAVEPGTGGVSVAPDDPMRLPRHRRPPEFDGTGKDPVWAIDSAALVSELRYRRDLDNPDRHGLIEPATKMSFHRFCEALEAIVPLWRRVGR